MARKMFGLGKLNRKLKRIPVEVRAEIQKALLAGGVQIVEMQKNFVPVRSGKLRDSIVASLGSQNVPRYAALRGGPGLRGRGDPELTMIISAGNTRVRYAHLVEFGTARHIIRSRRGKAMGRYGQFGHVVDHPGAPAQPFFFPAYRAQRKYVKARITRAITKAAKKVAAS